ncbi:MAG: hypothetical protein GC182_10820 [Rhodopseudomonas sp.]|nr:hypothetical protein [Rhodopseudomonas sp.]
MADYYPLIARAVAGLDKNSGENRRALYERARSALVNQLRGVDPPLDESEITRERLALEDAIRRLEAESVKRPRTESPPHDDQPAQPDTSHPVETPRQPPQATGGEERPSLRQQAMREFRSTVAEAEGLGEASAVAKRSARAAYDDVQGYDTPGYEPRAEQNRPAAARHDVARHDTAAHDEAYGHAGAAEDHYFEPPADDHYDAGGYEPPPEPPAGHEEWHPPAAADHLPDEAEVYHGPPRDYRRIAKLAAMAFGAVIVLILAVWQGGALLSAVTHTVASLTTAPAPVKPKVASDTTTQRKITDRIGSSDSGGANAPSAAVAQKVVLYDEDPSDPKGKRYVGSAVWRTETVSPGPGLAPELAVRADVEIPERRLRMTWSLRRNTDKALPASHTIEIMFTLPADFAEGGINNVPGVLMKQDEQARGVPLAGLAVKVTNGYFLIGLSSVSVDLQRNIQLLKERDWFDIPIVYTSGKRGILAVEKGTPGARAFEEAFRAWGQ